MTSNEDEIRAVLASRTEAQRSKDIDRLMSFYSPDTVYYDAVAPLRFTGAEEMRRNFVRWFDGYQGPIGLETHDLTIVASDEVAFANMLHLDSGKHKGGIELAIWVRETVCLRRVAGAWTITHEHISLPFNPANFQIWFATEKDSPVRRGKNVLQVAVSALVARFA
ncbi:YybH family protein [Nocardia blacklockiae]|uniref:YybH family protein n=1 Tax=Nocardia blacklockiae TaxID=480036 RepID=UPI0018949049|nr:nuclear transport factor 2 family protein [Nocardia blacklockiae]MBF6171948.1 nuclear transport factor 2 family protein [Nocardia blacklockiae]